VFQRYTQRGERGPQANGGKRVQIGFHGPILDAPCCVDRSWEPKYNRHTHRYINRYI
jgi:hypothetical protein